MTKVCTHVHHGTKQPSVFAIIGGIVDPKEREKKEIFALLGLTVFEKKKHRLGVFAEQCTGLHLIN